MARAIVVSCILLVVAACSGSNPVGAPDEYDCRHSDPGTGDLADDVVGRWFFVQNASHQYLAFDADGVATRTWTSDEHDDVEYTRHAHTVDGNVVAIEDYGTYAFALSDTGLWTVPDPAADTDWIRCRPLEPGRR